MIGRFLSKCVKVVTVPIDACEAALDLATGGDGSKWSRKQMQDAVPCLSSARDAVCEILQDLDDK